MAKETPKLASPSRYGVTARGSSAVRVLEVVWDQLREIHRAIPAAVLTLVDMRSRGRMRGYFAQSAWKKRHGTAHEIALSPNLIQSPDQLLAVMLHEAAHAVLYESGDKGGVGSTSYYHTKKFREQCQRLGLNCGFRNTRYGWTVTTWPERGVPAVYKPVLDYLKRQLPAGTGAPVARGRPPKPLPPPGYTILHCHCDEGRRTVSVKRTVLKAGGVLCRFCGQEFQILCEN